MEVDGRAPPLGQARSSKPLCSLDRETQRAMELRIRAFRCGPETFDFLQSRGSGETGNEERSFEVSPKSS